MNTFKPRLSGIIILIATAVFVLALAANEGAGGGNNSDGKPTPDNTWYDNTSTSFSLSTAEQLAGLAALVNSGTDGFSGKIISLAKNIDLSAYKSDEGWTPIGKGANKFRGTFDGNGNKISNMTVISCGGGGFFYSLDSATVKNLGLEDVKISCGKINIFDLSGIPFPVGGVAAVLENGSTVSNCYVSGSLDGNLIVGGVAGEVGSGSTVNNCYATAEVYGTDYVGGVAGIVHSSGSVSNCAALNQVILQSSDSSNLARVAGGNNLITYTYSARWSKICGRTATDNRLISTIQNAIPSMDWLAKTDNRLIRSVQNAICGLVGEKKSNYGILAGNAAWDSMTVLRKRTPISDSNLDGTGISTATIQADGSIGARFTAEGGWTTENGKLPGFGAATELPVHLR